MTVHVWWRVGLIKDYQFLQRHTHSLRKFKIKLISLVFSAPTVRYSAKEWDREPTTTKTDTNTKKIWLSFLNYQALAWKILLPFRPFMCPSLQSCMSLRVHLCWAPIHCQAGSPGAWRSDRYLKKQIQGHVCHKSRKKGWCVVKSLAFFEEKLEFNQLVKHLPILIFNTSS